MVLLVVLDVVSGRRSEWRGGGRHTQTRREFRSERMDAICIVTGVDLDLGRPTPRWILVRGLRLCTST